MVGCDRKNSRSWLENMFGNELSRVYPTENLEDLFEEFPDGFEINQVIMKDEVIIDVILIGSKVDKSLKGNIIITNRQTSVEIEKESISYENGSIVIENKSFLDHYWPQKAFLLKYLNLNRPYLKSLYLKEKSHNFQNGDMSLRYQLTSSEIIKYLHLNGNDKFTMQLGGSESNRGFYYSVSVYDNDNEFYFSERILDSKN